MKLHEVLQSVLEYDRDEVDLEPRGVRDKINVPSDSSSDYRGDTDDNPIKTAAEEILGHDTEWLGTGNFAVAFGSSDGRVARVTKWARSYDNLHNDGYFRWIGAIVKSGMNLENPYLPRIYNIKFKKNADNNYAYIVETEKLINLKAFDGEHDYKLFIAAGERIFGEDLMQSVMQKRGFKYEDDNPKTYTLGSFLIRMVKESFENNGKNLKDGRLKKAFELIDDIYVDMNKSKFVNDVGGDNILFRRTPHGIFPVLTDPVFG